MGPTINGRSQERLLRPQVQNSIRKCREDFEGKPVYEEDNKALVDNDLLLIGDTVIFFLFLFANPVWKNMTIFIIVFWLLH